MRRGLTQGNQELTFQWTPEGAGHRKSGEQCDLGSTDSMWKGPGVGQRN